MATTPIEFNFNNLAIGTDIENLNGWFVAGQGSSETATVQSYPTGKSGYSSGINSGRLVTSGGLWAYLGTSNTSYTDVDWRGTFTGGATNATLLVRSQNNNFFSSGYGVNLVSGTTVNFIKNCSNNQFVLASVSLNHSLSAGIVFRLMMIGLVLYAWINGLYVGSYDYTGDVLCSSATFNSGGLGFHTIGTTAYIDGTKPNPTVGGFL